MRADVAFYVSGHGFGHATRISALIRAIRSRGLLHRPVSIAVRSEAPHWIFSRRSADVQCSSAAIDIGILQRGGLDLDLGGSLAAHERFAAGWDAAVEREANFMREIGARLIVADIPAIAFAAADRAGIRAVGVANFSWDWILDAYTAGEPRWGPIVERHRAAYATADRLYRLPLAGDLSVFPRIKDVPLLVNCAEPDVEACRIEAGITPRESRRIVLVSFGGLGHSAARFGAGADLRDYLFVGTGPHPEGFPGDWLALDGPDHIAHERLIRASDAVLGKPGFSTIAEVLAHERRFLYVSRENFRENEVLVDALGSECAREMPRADFESGDWRPHLDALFAMPAPSPAPRTDGAEVIADELDL